MLLYLAVVSKLISWKARPEPLAGTPARSSLSVSVAVLPSQLRPINPQSSKATSVMLRRGLQERYRRGFGVLYALLILAIPSNV
jgi:hypothetical protein